MWNSRPSVNATRAQRGGVHLWTSSAVPTEHPADAEGAAPSVMTVHPVLRQSHEDVWVQRQQGCLSRRTARVMSVDLVTGRQGRDTEVSVDMNKTLVLHRGLRPLLLFTKCELSIPRLEEGSFGASGC